MNRVALKKIIQLDTAGWIAVSSFFICGLSGILLAIPYDFQRAYSSIYELLLFNPAGSLVRNVHYWSAELFFVFTLFHVFDHLYKSTESNIRSGRIWLMLCLAIAFLGYEMLTGFILKADAAGLQARRIFQSLLESVPYFGKMLSSAFSGTEEQWLIVYVQHIGLGMIILLIGMYEHVKFLRSKVKTTLIVASLLLFISFFFRAPLGFSDSNALKGPWFFWGLQELLHWTSHPGNILWLLALFFGSLVLLYLLRGKSNRLLKWVLSAIGIVYLILILVVYFFRGENWEWKFSANEPIALLDPIHLLVDQPTVSFPVNTKPEGCLVCHKGMKGLSDSHNPATIGCYACHKGDPFTSDKRVAHLKMIMVPGDFSNVRQTCGTQNCHKEITDRLMTSPMTTANGIVGVDKFVFGETSSLNDTFRVNALGNSMADSHLRNLCAGCHLGNEKSKTGNADWLDRGGGCNACHLHYNEKALATMNRLQGKQSVAVDEVHPTIDIQVSNDRCKSCHSRSGRISLSYEGWNETSLKPTEVSDTIHFKILPDDRVVEAVSSDIHHQKGMACIDCHGSYEIMGDGNSQVHKEDAVNVQCIDCHPAGKPNMIAIGKLKDRESILIAGLRKLDPSTKVIVTGKEERPLLNTTVDSTGRILLKDKLTGGLHESKPMSMVCSNGKGHNRLSCESCHSAWVPQCIGCHTAFERGTPGIDMLTGRPTNGSWVEYAGKIMAEPPVLGISEKAGGKVVTTMPGMVMTIDRESFTPGMERRFLRLYAPASGHTTQREGRSCKSCHNNPLAIGYGRGELKYIPSGRSGNWTFIPRFALNENDHLPEDAWIGFLKESKVPNSTRSNLRPFSVKEQMRILEVGSCLTCHDDQSKAMELALENFQQALNRRSWRCFK